MLMFSLLIWVLDTQVFALRENTFTYVCCQLKVQKYIYDGYVARKNLQKLNSTSKY